jgi:hypothetical protein
MTHEGLYFLLLILQMITILMHGCHQVVEYFFCMYLKICECGSEAIFPEYIVTFLMALTIRVMTSYRFPISPLFAPY